LDLLLRVAIEHPGTRQEKFQITETEFGASVSSLQESGRLRFGSPLIVLINIGQIEILSQLFGAVLIPPVISAELRNEKQPPVIHSNREPSCLWIDKDTFQFSAVA